MVPGSLFDPYHIGTHNIHALLICIRTPVIASVHSKKEQWNIFYCNSLHTRILEKDQASQKLFINIGYPTQKT